MRVDYGLGLASLALACATPSNARPAAEPEPATPEPAPASGAVAAERAEPRALSGFVLLRPTAWLRTAPHPEADGAPVYHEALPSSASPLDGTIVQRAIARSGPWIAIETGEVDWDDAVCHAARGRDRPLRGFELTVWVHEQDLQPVLVEPIERSTEDGRAVQLSPGLAVGESSGAASGQRIVAATSMLLTIEVPDASIGLVYQPRPDPPVPRGFHLPPVCGDEPCSVDASPIADVESVDGLAAKPLSSGGRRGLVELHTNCARVTAAVRVQDLVQGEQPRGGGGSACGGYARGRDYEARGGAPVYFADGALAGKVVDTGTFLYAHGSEDLGDRRCFEVDPVGSGPCAEPDHRLTLCILNPDVWVMPDRETPDR